MKKLLLCLMLLTVSAAAITSKKKAEVYTKYLAANGLTTIKLGVGFSQIVALCDDEVFGFTEEESKQCTFTALQRSDFDKPHCTAVVLSQMHPLYNGVFKNFSEVFRKIKDISLWWGRDEEAWAIDAASLIHALKQMRHNRFAILKELGYEYVDGLQKLLEFNTKSKI